MLCDNLENWCLRMSDRMWARQRFITQGCIERGRLKASAESESKVILYRAPLGYGKSVQVAFEAGTQGREEGASPISIRDRILAPVKLRILFWLR